MEENINTNIENLTEEQLEKLQIQVNAQLEYLSQKRIAWEAIGEKLLDFCKEYGSFVTTSLSGTSLTFEYKETIEENEEYIYSIDFSTIGEIKQSKIKKEIEDAGFEDSNEENESFEISNSERDETLESTEDSNLGTSE